MEAKLKWLSGFSLFVLGRFDKDRCISIASELTVTSLLALVPLLTVSYALLSVFPLFQDMESQIQYLIFNNFIPESSLTIQSYINQYVKNSEGLTSIGFLVLLLTSIMLMRTIDRSFNLIWQVNQLRSPVRVFLVYWAVLTLGPILLAASVLLSSYFASLPLLAEVVNEQSQWLKRGLPFLLENIAFLVMFIAVPNRRVEFKDAAIASLITAVLFELAKSLFAIFVQKFSSYQLVFGAIASIPLFLLWVQFSWMIILLGAEICHALDVFVAQRRKLSQPFILAARVLKLMIEAQQSRQLVTYTSIQKQLYPVRNDRLLQVIQQMHAAGIIKLVDGEELLLRGDSDSYTYLDIYQAGFVQLP
ncbi:MAG: YihY family inner membrane protein, partial [Kangiellaceae bacterium]|nr:YihY family inner membrane protein [Kangiellaceae bacterium]